MAARALISGPVRPLLRGPQQATQGALRAATRLRRVLCCPPRASLPEAPPGGPPEAIFLRCALVHARLGMSWRRNELITLTVPKSGVARTVCYVNCFVQHMANIKTYLPTITPNTEKHLLICFRLRRIEESA